MLDSATPWTAALWAPLSIGFSRQEHCSGLPCPPLQGIFPTQGSNLHLLHWQVDSLLLSHQASPYLSTPPQFFVTKLKYQLSEASIHKSRKAVFLTFLGIPQNFICPNDWMECRIYLRVFNWASLITQLVKNRLQRRRPWSDSWVGKIRWRRDRLPTPVFSGFPCGSAGKESTCSVGELGLIPGLGRSPGEGKGHPLQYSGLENSMDCMVHGVTESDTTERLSLTFTSQLYPLCPLSLVVSLTSPVLHCA